MMSHFGDESLTAGADGEEVQSAGRQHEVNNDLSSRSSQVSSAERARERRARLAALQQEQMFCHEEAELERLRLANEQATRRLRVDKEMAIVRAELAIYEDPDDPEISFRVPASGHSSYMIHRSTESAQSRISSKSLPVTVNSVWNQQATSVGARVSADSHLAAMSTVRQVDAILGTETVVSSVRQNLLPISTAGLFKAGTSTNYVAPTSVDAAEAALDRVTLSSVTPVMTAVSVRGENVQSISASTITSSISSISRFTGTSFMSSNTGMETSTFQMPLVSSVPSSFVPHSSTGLSQVISGTYLPRSFPAGVSGYSAIPGSSVASWHPTMTAVTPLENVGSIFAAPSFNPFAGGVNGFPRPEEVTTPTQILPATLESIMKQNQIPKLELKVSEGDPMDFQQWLVSFEKLVEEATNDPARRLHYLSQYTAGNANVLVSGHTLGQSEQDYQNAKAELKTEFGNPYILARAYIEKIEKWPCIKANDGEALNEFATFLKKCKGSLPSLRHLQQLNTDLYLQEIVAKLPYAVQGNWCKILVNVKTRMKT
jgi:hypothetical protein